MHQELEAGRQCAGAFAVCGARLCVGFGWLKEHSSAAQCSAAAGLQQRHAPVSSNLARLAGGALRLLCGWTLMACDGDGGVPTITKGWAAGMRQLSTSDERLVALPTILQRCFVHAATSGAGACFGAKPSTAAARRGTRQRHAYTMRVLASAAM